MNRSRVTGDLASHGNIFVDIANDRVGIGSTIPGEKLSLPDDAKISLGDSTDLKIYHTGNTSVIKHNNGSGDLILDALSTGSDIRLRSEAEFKVEVGGSTHIQVYKNGGVSLHQAGTGAGKKLETMSTGARVTGTLDVTSGITLDDSITHSGDTNTKIRFPANDTISFETAGIQAFRNDSSGHFILGRDYSTNPSNGLVGITTIRGHRVNEAGDYARLHFKNSSVSGNSSASIRAYRDGSNYSTGLSFYLNYSTSSGGDGQERFRINSLGRVVTQFFSSNQTYAANDTTQLGYQAQNLSDVTNTYAALRLTAGNSSPATAQLSSIRTGSGQNDFTIQLESSNTAFEALRIKNNGKVGIGTDNPDRNLDVFKGSGNDCTVSVRVKTAGAWFEANSMTSSGYYGLKLRNGNTEKWFLGSYGSNNLQLKTATANASSIMEVTSAGKIGINESSPLGKLHVKSGDSGVSAVGSSADELVLENDTNAGMSILSATNGEGGINFGDSDDINIGKIAYNHSDNAMFFKTNDDERLRIASDGKIGINQAAPTCQLQIDSGSSGAGTVTVLELNHKGNDTNDAVKLNFARVGGDIGSIVLEKVASNNTTDFIFNTRSFNTVSESLRITGAGNVGINQTNPTVKLQVTDTSATILRTEATANSGDALIQALGKNSSGNDRMIQMRTDAGAGQYRIISSDTDYNLALCTGNAPRVLIAGSSAATSIGGSNVFNAMLTTQGDVSGGLLMLKATENTNRLFVTGTNTNGVEVNLYDEGGNQRGILGVSGSEFFIKAPHSNAPMTFHTHNGSSIGERARIDTTGRFLINRTVSNLNAQLQVGGRYVDASTSTLNLDGTGNDGAVLHLMETGNTADRIALMVFDHGSLKSAIGGGRGNASNWGTDLRFYTHKETTTDIHQTYERMRIRPDAITTFGSSGSPYQANTVSIHPDDGMVCFGMDGRTTLMSNQNSCYIFSGSGASGDIPAGTLILQSRSNVDRNIVFATGATPSEKWIIHGASGALRSYNYLPAGGYSSSTSNGYDIYLKLQGTLPTANSGVETTIINTNSIGDAGVYILVLRSFEQSQTGGKLWSVRIVSSTFYIHSGSGNDAETVTVPVTHMGHHNGGSNPPVTIKMHMDNGPAHTHGKITYTPNGFSYGGTNCDYYFYKLIDV